MVLLLVIWWQVGDMQGGQSSAAQLLSGFSFQVRTRELENLQHTVEELQAQVHSMDGAKGWFERRLKEAEVSWWYLVKVQSWLSVDLSSHFFLLDWSWCLLPKNYNTLSFHVW